MGSKVESQAILNEEEQTCLLALQLANSIILPMVLKSAVELDLFEILVRAGEGKYLSPKEIAAQIPTQNSGGVTVLDRILRFLASCSVLKCGVSETPKEAAVEWSYAAGPVCKYLTRNGDRISLVALLMMNQLTMEKWCHLKDAVLEGKIPFNTAFGMTLFEYCAMDQKYRNTFNQAMSDLSVIYMKKILDTYTGFEGLDSLVDVGGGVGATLNMITSKYPSIKGINFDLPHVIDNAPTFHGVEHVGGDMFVSIPKGDAIFMKHLCHDWTDDNCSKILTNCYDALPPGGKVIIAERILPIHPSTSLETKNIFHVDMIMLTDTPGGRERTEKEYEALAKNAGFTGFQVMCSAYDLSVMEFLKNV